MFDRTKLNTLFERPHFNFEDRFDRSGVAESFNRVFFNFDDRLYPWTTVYRYMLFMSLDKDIRLMIGIGQKNAPDYYINGLKTTFESNPPKYKVGLSYWCYSGELIHKTKNEVIRNSGDKFDSETIHFQKTDVGYMLNINEIGTDVKLKEQDGHDFLHLKFIFSPFYRCNKYLPFYGTILGKKTKGIAIIQKANANMPFIPWVWGRSFFENGAQLEFYEPRVLVPLYKRLNFRIGGVVYKFRKSTKIERIPDGEYPLWKLSGKTREGEELDVDIKSYAHVCNNFETKRTCFSYSAYPSKVTKLKFKKGNKTITLEDLGDSVANCENAHYTKKI